MAAGLLKVVSRLADPSILPSEPMLRFLSHCCCSLLALFITLQQELPEETNHKRCVCHSTHLCSHARVSGIKTHLSTTSRDAIWGACVLALSSVPHLLRALLQQMQVKDVKEAELPQLGQILSMLLQHTPLHSPLMASSALLQDIIQQLTVTTHETRTRPLLVRQICPSHPACVCVCFRDTTEGQPGNSG